MKNSVPIVVLSVLFVVVVTLLFSWFYPGPQEYNLVLALGVAIVVYLVACAFVHWLVPQKYKDRVLGYVKELFDAVVKNV